MMNENTISNRIIILTFLVGVVPGCGFCNELQNKDVTVVIEKKGSGFIDSISFKGKEIVKAQKEFLGGEILLTRAGNGELNSLFSHKVTKALKSSIVSVHSDGKTLKVSGAYTDGRLKVPFTREITLGAEAVLSVKETTDFSLLDPQFLVAAHNLKLPLVIGDNPHHRMFGFGGAYRAELLRMDMNDMRRRTQCISAPRCHWPSWDIAGIRQLTDSYKIWYANHNDTMAYPIEEGIASKGWADYSERDWGVTAVIGEPVKSAPWAISINGKEGVMTLANWPADVPPVSGKELTKRTFSFRLMMHETSWPATYPCELDRAKYEAFLKILIPGAKSLVESGIGTSDSRQFIEFERIQPSVVFRMVYRGDAWRMKSLLKKLGFEMDVPRNQPLEEWEKVAQKVLDSIREKGEPSTPAVRSEKEKNPIQK